MSHLWIALLAFAVSLLSGPFVLPALRRLNMAQIIRREGPSAHLKKAGTPTMGGILFLLGTTLALIISGTSDLKVWVALGMTWGFGLLGFADDYRKVARHDSLGIKARTKLVVGLVLALTLAFLAQGPLHLGTVVRVPFYGHPIVLAPALYDLLVVLVVLGTNNAVNLSDGLDGLASGLSIIALAFFAYLCSAEHFVGLSVYSLALLGSVSGFLYYNLHPAKVFMGDFGALALGGALASLAVLTQWELLLPVVGGIFVLEALSVIAQVISFRLFGKRVLKMSPLHHHFELVGWSESRVVSTFWLGAVILALVGYLGHA